MTPTGASPDVTREAIARLVREWDVEMARPGSPARHAALLEIGNAMRNRFSALSSDRRVEEWQPIETAPKYAMPVLLFSRTVRFWRIEGGGFADVPPDDERAERMEVGYWDGTDFCYSGSNHAVFECSDDRDNPDKPTHWRPLPAPPVDGEPE